jgi:HEAT repeat protein
LLSFAGKEAEMTQKSEAEIRDLVKRFSEYLYYSEDDPADLKAICEIGSPAVPYLLDVLNFDHTPGERYTDGRVIEALGEIGDDRALPALHRLHEVHTAKDITRHLAITLAIAQCGDVSVFPELIGWLIEGTARWYAAFRALLALGQKAVPGLLNALDDPDYWINQSAYLTDPTDKLAGLDPQRMLDDRRQRLQRAIARVLQKIGTPEALAALESWQQDRSAKQ